MPHTARHARHRAHRTAVLPALLIAAAGSALAGLAVLPGPASANSTAEPERILAAAPLTPADQAEAAALAQSVAQERRDERASRDRTAAAAPVPPPVVAPPPPPPPPPPQFVRPGTGRLTSSYGARWGRLHAGMDVAAGTGAPISAVAAGTVASAGAEGGYGRAVRLRHDDGTVTLYAHMSELLVTSGQRVTPGTYLGLEGASGNVTGPHLHFEVRVAEVPVDPEVWLQARGVDPAGQ